MPKKIVLIVVTAVAAAGAFLVSQSLGAPAPATPLQMVFFTVLQVIKSLAFGAGVSYLVSLPNILRGRSTREWVVFISAAWVLIFRLPYGWLSRIVGTDNYTAFLVVDYVFSLSAIIAAIIVASYLWKLYASSASQSSGQ